LGLPLIIVEMLTMLCLTIGYKTKLVSVVLITALFVQNISHHDFWFAEDDKTYEWKQNEFFFILSLIGGVIHLHVYGAGGISVDHRLKSQ